MAGVAPAAPPPSSDAALVEKMQQLDDYFASLMELMHPDLYFPVTDEEADLRWNKYMKVRVGGGGQGRRGGGARLAAWCRCSLITLSHLQATVPLTHRPLAGYAPAE